jgi:hypothetical protein
LQLGEVLRSFEHSCFEFVSDFEIRNSDFKVSRPETCMTATVKYLATHTLKRFGIEPRPFRALLGSFLLMDFRGSHYSQSTGVKPREVLSPLVCVIGQCLLLSGISAGVLFRRVDVFFFAFANLSVSMLVIVAAVVVEFQEVVFDVRDLHIVASRPVASRTYSAARFANLLCYVLAMWLGLNLFPLIAGAGLRDAGPWFLPAYLTASLAAAVTTAAGVILLLAGAGDSARLSRWRDVLAWAQVAMLLVVGYGAQLMFRRRDYSLEMWAAFPPEWVAWLPSAWLGRFVEHAAVAPDASQLGTAVAIAALAVFVSAAAVIRLAGLYGGVHAVEGTRRATTVAMPRVGQLRGPISRLLCRNRAERAGYWLARTMLLRDGGLRMRCLYAFNTVAAVVILGVGTQQFDDPLQVREADKVMLSILSVYLVCLAVPVALYNVTFVQDAAAAWLLFASPVDPPEGIARGVCKALLAYVVAPLCIVLGLVAGWAWGSPLSAALHALLAFSLCWPMALATLWGATPGHPFTRDPSRGGSIGPVVVPLAGLGTVVMLVATLHLLWGGEFWFWIAVFAATIVATLRLGPVADRRMRTLWERAG